MNCNLILTDEFERKAKKLSKKYRSLKKDLATLFDSLLENPYQGDQIKTDVYKIRLAIKSKGKGKSGGARVITYLETQIIEQEETTDLYLITIYDKSDTENISDQYINQIIDNLQEGDTGED
ncbi:MAG: hypothetical protein AAF806_17730 [Bacteroidota bacterium]